MKRGLQTLVIIALVLGGVIPRLNAPLGPDTARAAISSCSASITPHTVQPGTTASFQLSITNDDAANDVQHVMILRPSSDFTIQAADGEGWGSIVASDQVVMEGNSIPAPDTHIFTIQAQVANVEAGAANWSVYASDSPDGSGSQMCTGDLSTEITSNQPFSISGVAASSVTASSAHITWTTNRPGNSRVDYGKTTGYGTISATSETEYATSHAITLAGLAPNTTYHYRATSVTDTGQSAQSGDGTFTTPSAPVATPAPAATTVPGGSTTGNVPSVAIKTAPTESVPPTVSLVTNLTKPYPAAPAITGAAQDNEAVARVEYSTDNGQNWQPVTDIKQTVAGNPRSVTFGFIPILAEDGNYQIIVRAVDSSSNIAATPAKILVIDRLAPQLGGLAITFGPQTLLPGPDGATKLVAGPDYRVTAGAVGGPVEMSLEAVPAITATAALAGTKRAAASFSLGQNTDSGLWTGVLSFRTGGLYQLVVHTLDGAGNKTVRVVGAVRVAVPGRIIMNSNRDGARVTVYVHEPTSRTWQVWQAAPYSQFNPQTTGPGGSYSYMLPSGEYYLQVSADRYVTYTSDTFRIDRATSITNTIQLNQAPQLKFGSTTWWLPGWSWQSQPLSVNGSSTSASTKSSLLGHAAPAFQLKTLTGKTVRDLAYMGKPTVYTFLSTWSPSSQDQIAALTKLQANHDINVVPIFVAQPAGAVTSYINTARYQLEALADPDCLTAAPYHVGSVPYHVFVDRAGTVKSLMVRVLSTQELLTALGGL